MQISQNNALTQLKLQGHNQKSKRSYIFTQTHNEITDRW